MMISSTPRHQRRYSVYAEYALCRRSPVDDLGWRLGVRLCGSTSCTCWTVSPPRRGLTLEARRLAYELEGVVYRLGR